jgi:hypothetical protein
MPSDLTLKDLMGPPKSPEVVGRQQGIEADPWSDPVALIAAILTAGMSTAPAAAQSAARSGATETMSSVVSRARQLGADIQFAIRRGQGERARDMFQQLEEMKRGLPAASDVRDAVTDVVYAVGRKLYPATYAD